MSPKAQPNTKKTLGACLYHCTVMRDGPLNEGGFTMGRTKQGNRNAQSNNNVKKGNRTSSEMVEFTTGQAKEKKNRFQD
jgi:hypothetical protein